MVMLTLVSNDDIKFEVEREILKQSGTIETLIVGLNLDDDESDTATMPIPLPNVKAVHLEQVIEWCRQHKDDLVKEEEEDGNKDIVIPDWDKQFLDKFEKNTLLEIVMAANYLEVKELLVFSCKTVANLLKNKPIEAIREEWNIENQFTPEEEATIRKENEWCE